MIRAILVDIGGVLLSSDWKAVTARWEADLRLPPGGLLNAMYRGSDDTVLIGRVSEDDWWVEICRRLGADTGLRQQIERSFHEQERRNEPLVQFLASLRPTLRLAFVSNAWPGGCWAARTRWRLHEVSDSLIFSCEVGVAKPNPGIYRIACERLGVEPAEAIFNDDGRENIEAAAALGMQVFLFEEAQRVIEEVRRLLGAPAQDG